MSNSQQLYDATVDKIWRQLSGLSPIAKAMVLHQVCRVLALPALEYGEPEGLSTPSPPQAAQTSEQVIATELLKLVASLPNSGVLEITRSQDGSLSLVLRLGQLTGL